MENCALPYVAVIIVELDMCVAAAALMSSTTSVGY